MTPDFPDEITLLDAGESTTDPDTGNTIPGVDVPRVVRGNLQRRPFFTVEGERTLEQWVLLLPTKTVIHSTTSVEGRGLKFEVDALPAERRDGSQGWTDAYVAVQLKYISDLQE